MNRDPRKIGLIFSIMLTLPGTPVIYYGDEFGKLNDERYYQEMILLTGKNDTRFLVRGKVDWDEVQKQLKISDSYFSGVFSQVKRQINTRRHHKCFGRGDIHWMDASNASGKSLKQVMSFIRNYDEEKILVLINLSPAEAQVVLPAGMNRQGDEDLLGNRIVRYEYYQILMPPYGYLWLNIS
jgi:maltose alpha-D-glucosyltransferase/alpha-amylase